MLQCNLRKKPCLRSFSDYMNNIKYSQYAIYYLQKSIFESNTANTKKRKIGNGIEEILHIITSHKSIVTTEKQNTVYQY